MNSNRTIILLIASLIIGVITSFAAIHSRSQDNSSVQSQQLDDKSQWPIADFSAMPPDDPKEKAKRIARNKKHNPLVELIGPGSENFLVYHWPPGFPAIPTALSDAVVIGQVSDVNAYLSDDKNGVYSEVSIRVDQVLKDDLKSPITPGYLVVAERNGGRVRYPSGQISGLYFAGLGIPRVKRHYLLFLTRNDQEEYYHILTGYELRAGRVFPLDRTTSSDTDFDAYINADEVTFLKKIRNAIPASTPAQP